MKKKDNGQGGYCPRDWDDYEQDNNELYSYLKKKGKHRRAEKKRKNR